MEAEKVRGLISHFEDLSTHSTSRAPSFCSTSSRSSVVERRPTESKEPSRLAKLSQVIKSKLESKAKKEKPNVRRRSETVKVKANKVSEYNVNKDKLCNELKRTISNRAKANEDKPSSEDKNKLKKSKAEDKITKKASKDKAELKRRSVKPNKAEVSSEFRQQPPRDNTQLENEVLLRKKEPLVSLNEDGVIGGEGRSSIVSQNRKIFEKKMREEYEEIRISMEIRKSSEIKRRNERKKNNESKCLNSGMTNNEDEIKNGESELNSKEAKFYEINDEANTRNYEVNDFKKNQRKEHIYCEITIKEEPQKNNAISTSEINLNDLRATNEMRKRQFFATDEEKSPPIKDEEIQRSCKLEVFEDSHENPYEIIYVTFEELHQSYKPKNYNQNELIYETIPDFEEEALYDTLFPPELDDEKTLYENVFLPHSRTRINYENFSCNDLRCCSSTFYIPLQNHQCANKTDSSYYSGDEDDLESDSNDSIRPSRLVEIIAAVNPELDAGVTIYENFVVKGPNAGPNVAIHLDKDKKDYIVEELIYTEAAYVESLDFVIKNYMIYLKENTESSKYKYIFTNIENIYLETKHFKEDIKRCKYKYVEIGQAFLRHKNLFARYPVYCKNKAKSLQLIEEDFNDIITKREKELEDKLGLSSHLLKPIQRLAKYELLLKSLHACLKEDRKELAQKSVEAAIVMVQRVARRGNDLITLTTIEDNPHTIVETGGLLLKEFFKLHSPKKMEVMLFLFEKILIFTTKKKQEGYMYYTYISLESLARRARVEPNIFVVEDYDMKKRHGDPPFVLETKEAEIKEKWTKQIDELLWMQLIKRKEEAKTKQRPRHNSATEASTKKAGKTKEKRRLFSFSLAK